MVDATDEPDVRTRVMNGVAVPSVDPEADRDCYPDHEHASISSLRHLTRRGDSVVVVGGGWGASTVVAARMTHSEGDVTTFEPSSEMVRTIARTIEVNNVSELVTVEHASIGPVREENERYFGAADGEQLPPTAVPECDVLELDCDGAEVAILEALGVRPRVVIVEVHPLIGCATGDVKSALGELGYEVVDEGVAGMDGGLPVLTATRVE